MIVSPEDKSNYGKHEYEHEVFIIKGNGKMIEKDCEELLNAGMVFLFQEMKNTSL